MSARFSLYIYECDRTFLLLLIQDLILYGVLIQHEDVQGKHSFMGTVWPRFQPTIVTVTKYCCCT